MSFYRTARGVGLLLAALTCFGQTEAASEGRLDRKEIEALKSRAEESTTLPPSLQKRILSLYEEALDAIQTAESARAEVRRYERERVRIAGRVEVLRNELAKPPLQPPLRLPADLSVSDLEARLTQERALLEASRSSLREIEQLAEQSASRRTDIARRLGQLDRQIEALSDELRDAGTMESNPEASRALRISLRARRAAATVEKERLRAELAFLEAQASLLPWQRDQVRRRVEYHMQLVAFMEAELRQRRKDQNQERLEATRKLCEKVAGFGPEFQASAASTEKYAALLWGERGVLTSTEETQRRLAETRKHIAELNRIAELTRRRFEAAGSGTTYLQWWPKMPEGFPTLVELSRDVEERQRLIPELQLQLIQLEEQRGVADETARAVLRKVDRLALDEEQKRELRRSLDELLRTKRDLLEELIQRYTQYLNRVIELDELTQNLLSEMQQTDSFLRENLFWSRTISSAFPPQPQHLMNAVAWLLDPGNWRTVVRAIWDKVSERPVRAVVSLLLLVLLVGFRKWIKRRLCVLGERARDLNRAAFHDTLEAVLHTALLAAPLPVLLLLLSRALTAEVAPTQFAFALERTAYYLAGIAALFTAIRHISRPNGLAEAHFGGFTVLVRGVHRGFFWAELFVLPLLYVSLHLGWAGLRLDSPEELRALSDSLGRMAFVAALFLLAISMFAVFRPRWANKTPLDRATSLELRRVSYWAYPAITLVAVVPALTALFGYYLTGLMLGYQFFRTISLVVALLVIAGLMERWWSLRLRRDRAASPEVQAATSQLEPRVRQLFHFTIITLAAVGLYSIWSEALPAMQALKRVQLYPTVALLSPVGETAAPGAPVAAPGAGETPAGSKKAPQGGSPRTKGALPAAGGASAAAVAVATTLTLWNLGQALLAFLITMALVRDVPGLVELILLKRPGVDSGFRVAVSTLVRYAILIIGVSVTFGLLGLSWSKIQWLAAALTFGLGFGLQEIVANFVSGLILLIERPVRVGDAVTIGNLQGRVSRIQIRATTISLWDRSEMIVPNKEFITNKLVNWTLSDSKRRVDIPVRVAYGADVKRVKETLLAAARRFPQVLDDPPPQALLLEFGEQAMKFELRFFVDFGQGLATKDQVHEAIEELFKKEGIEFATPVLNIKTGAGSESAASRTEREGG